MYVFCCAHLSNDCWLIRCDVGQLITIDVLPDDVLLSIFDFYVVGYQDLEVTKVGFNLYYEERTIQSWQSLVHVCQRWRYLIFASPRRLNLQLCCALSGSARKSLDVWPALPLLIKGVFTETSVDNVIAELEHSDRICQINLNCQCHSISHIKKLWTTMQAPFPKLEVLSLSFGGLSYVPVLPDSFLGGSAPRLRYLALTSISFPGLSKLLLSATHLVNLWLVNIPHSGYISPKAMATCLSMLTSLESFHLEFESPQSSPDQENRRSPLPTRSILPSLTSFSFKGDNKYLEDLVSPIDAPRLDRLSTTFFNDIYFDAPELNQFITRTPTFGGYDEAHLIFHSRKARVKLKLKPEPSERRVVEVKILCQVLDWQLSSLSQICTLSLCPLLTMENLYIYEDRRSPPDWKDDIENTEWLNLLLPFTVVKNLYISKQFTPRIAPALQELTGGRITEVLPALQNVLLEGFRLLEPVQEGIVQFISARQLTNHPIAISVWDRSPMRILLTSQLLAEADALLNDASLKVQKLGSTLSPENYNTAQGFLEM